jgi:hypothetical protein
LASASDALEEVFVNITVYDVEFVVFEDVLLELKTVVLEEEFAIFGSVALATLGSTLVVFVVPVVFVVLSEFVVLAVVGSVTGIGRLVVLDAVELRRLEFT